MGLGAVTVTAGSSVAGFSCGSAGVVAAPSSSQVAPPTWNARVRLESIIPILLSISIYPPLSLRVTRRQQ
jgi:hypothetical protein